MRLTLNRRTDLALLALRELANSDGPVSGSVLGERIGTSLLFLPQVMAPLIQAGWVRSDRGPGGGYRLTESASQARLMDVIEATEGPAETGRCVMRDAPCPGDPSCPIHGVWMQARQVLVENFERIPAFIVEEGKTK